MFEAVILGDARENPHGGSGPKLEKSNSGERLVRSVQPCPRPGALSFARTRLGWVTPLDDERKGRSR
jgi:hypothetical protein